MDLNQQSIKLESPFETLVIREKNIFTSPASLKVILCMLLNAAANNSREQIATALEATMNLEDINTEAQALMNSFQDLSKDSKIELNAANGIWVNDKYDLKDEIKQTLGRDFYTEVFKINSSDTDLTKVFIEDWIKKNTQGLIKDTAPSINQDTMFILVNTLYFDAHWTNPFPKGNTQKKDFYLASGKEKRVDMMYQGGDFHYCETDDLEIVALPYGDSESAKMLVFLPKNGAELSQVLSSVDLNSVLKDFKREEKRKGFIHFPKFDLESEIDLSQVLKAMGVLDIFDPKRADFSPLVKGGARDPIFLESFIQKAVIKVSEKRTTAACVTYSNGKLMSYQPSSVPFEMKVNRPFGFVIESAGVPLFAGVIKDIGE